MVNWPESVPFFKLRSGWGGQPGDNVIRTPMDTGDAKARRRSTARGARVSGSAYMTREQAQRFDMFWRGTLKDGTLRFTKPDGIIRRRNLLVQSEDFSAGWIIPSQLTRSGSTSIFAGQSASRFLKTSGASVSIQQAVGTMLAVQTFTGVFETHGVDWPNAPTTSVSIWDQGAGSHAALGQINWSLSDTPTASILFGPGSVSCAPMGIGPNGGYMARFSVTASGGNVGNARSVFIYPTGTDTNTDAVTIHWAQLETGSAFTEYEPVGASYDVASPIRGGAQTYRLASLPQYAPMGLGFRVSVDLEVMP